MWRESTATPDTPLEGQWARSRKRASRTTRAVRVNIRVTVAQRRAWQAAARATGLTTSAWVIRNCARALPGPVPDEASEVLRDAQAAERLRQAREIRRAKEAR